MLKKQLIFSIVFALLFVADQYIKTIFVGGFEAQGSCISLILTYNYGVAFSMFEFLTIYLKYIQLLIIFGGIVYLYLNKDIFQRYYIPLSLLLAGGASNIFDRFYYGGVVDYIYWHCWFDFAIFNFADVLIDIAVVVILLINYGKIKA